MSFLHHLLNQLPEESRWIIMGDLRFASQAAIYNLILQLEQDILRKVLAKKGKDSDEYKFFQNILNALYQAGEAQHLIEKLNDELIQLKLYNDFLHQQYNNQQLELQRFKTIEELAAAGLLEAYINRIKSLTEKQKPPS